MRKANGHHLPGHHDSHGMGWVGMGWAWWRCPRHAMDPLDVAPQIHWFWRGATPDFLLISWSLRTETGLYPRVPVQGSRMCTIILTISPRRLFRWNRASDVSPVRQCPCQSYCAFRTGHGSGPRWPCACHRNVPGSGDMTWIFRLPSTYAGVSRRANAAPSRSEPFESSTRPHKPPGWWLCRAAAEDICINGKPAVKLGVVELENV
jgi:hypothetical protein